MIKLSIFIKKEGFKILSAIQNHFQYIKREKRKPWKEHLNDENIVYLNVIIKEWNGQIIHCLIDTRF